MVEYEKRISSAAGKRKHEKRSRMRVELVGKRGGAGSGMGSGKFNALWWVIWSQPGPKLAMILLMKNINAVEEVGALNSLVAVLPVI